MVAQLAVEMVFWLVDLKVAKLAACLVGQKAALLAVERAVEWGNRMVVVTVEY